MGWRFLFDNVVTFILGSYRSLEKTLLAMVLLFSFITLLIAISMQLTEFQVSAVQISEGLKFSFPTEYLPLALAVFGFTGISYGEIMAYTYWCLEKGYAGSNRIILRKLKIGLKPCKRMYGLQYFS